MDRPGRPPWRPSPALWIPALYAAVAATYVAVSDDLLGSLVTDPLEFERWSTRKGWGFVVASAALLHLGLRRVLAARDAATASLKRLEARSSGLVETSPEGIIVVARRTVVYANAAAVRLFRAPGPEALLGLPMLALVAPEDHAGVLERAEQAEAGRLYPPVKERRMRRLDGEYFQAEVGIASFTEDGVPGIQVTFRDVTQASALREELRESRQQLRALAGRLQTVREEEKTRMARDLHDELGQLLTGLKMDLRWIENHLGDLPPSDQVGPLLDRAVAAAQLADQTVASVQRIAAELRPGALDRLGLATALRQELRRFQERTGLACQAELDEAVPEPSPEAATALYRICQEALTNVSRHAEATRVRVALASGPGQVVLQVEDDGRGMDQAATGPEALGLLGMTERATLLGGEVRFERGPERGTLVTVRLPAAERGGER